METRNIGEQEAATRERIRQAKELERRMLPFRQAWVEGRQLQWRALATDPWQDIEEDLVQPAFGFGEWRVGPPPEVWLFVKAGEVLNYFTTRAAMESALSSGAYVDAEVVRYRRVS